MKNSGIEWIGEIPAHWDVLRGKNVLELLDKPVLSTDEVITCFRDGEVTLRRNRREEGFTFSEKEIGYQGIDIGDLIVHGMDGFAGAIGISDSRGKASPVLIVLNSKQNKRYLMYYLRSMAYRDIFLALSTGIRVRSCDLRWNKLSVLPFLIPDIEEQNEIVSYIDNKLEQVDELIANQQGQIEKLKEYKQSVITEAVTKGLDKSAPLKDSRNKWLGMIPINWEVRKLKNVCKLFGRIGFRGYKQEDLVEEGEGAITLSPSNMRDLGMNFSKCSYLSWGKYNESPEIQIFNGDILFVKTGSTFGKVALVEYLPMEATINPQIVVIKNISINTKYLLYFLSTTFIRSQIDCSVVGGTIPTISQEKILNYAILVPTKDEQQYIADYLDEKCGKIDRLIAIKQEKIEKLQEYKKSLIYEYVTGKKEVV